jgi:hypothetical protein
MMCESRSFDVPFSSFLQSLRPEKHNNTMPSRNCASCNRRFDKGSFSNNQWAKAVGGSRCYACVQQTGSSNSTQQDTETARRNNATHASFPQYNLDHPFAEGGFRWVARGTYTQGARTGEACVCKWFKNGQVFESTFFDLDIKAMNKALDLIREWNSKRYIGAVIKINIPQVWTFAEGSSRAGTKILQEPFIEHYQKFNSNTGWADNDTPWPRVMQALSHFTYHVSGGQFVLCDLQGGLYTNGVCLTDPVILSRNKQYGVTDLGPKGISSFFSNHTCNEYCKSNWSKPNDQGRYFAPSEGTSMMMTTTGAARTGAQQRVPTQRNRNQMSAFYGY